MPHLARQPHLNRMQIRADIDGDQNAAPATVAASAVGDEARGVRRRFLIIHNPVAGRNRVGLVHDVVRRLEQAGAIGDLLSLAECEADTNFVARIDTYDAIVASGGDGTARSIASLLQGHSTPLALIPGGTGNVLAAELDLPRDADAIAHMLLHGPVVRLSTGAVNDSDVEAWRGAKHSDHCVVHLLAYGTMTGVDALQDEIETRAVDA